MRRLVAVAAAASILDGGAGAGVPALAVSRITRTSKNYQGLLLTSFGGPRRPGVSFRVFLIQALKAGHLGAAAADYDWTGFDPRGVGSSIPAITCARTISAPTARATTRERGRSSAIGSHGRIYDRRSR